MPNCFSLTRKGESEPTSLNTIDVELCNVLGEPVDDVKYVWGWFDYIGFALATGGTYATIRETINTREYRTPEITQIAREVYTKILDHLEANYVPNAWVEIGRRR